MKPVLREGRLLCGLTCQVLLDGPLKSICPYGCRSSSQRHSGIRYVIPAQRHAGDDRNLLAAHHVSTTRLANSIRRAGLVRRAIDRQSAPSPLTRNGIRHTTMFSRWLHDSGDNYSDAGGLRRSAHPQSPAPMAILPYGASSTNGEGYLSVVGRYSPASNLRLLQLAQSRGT